MRTSLAGAIALAGSLSMMVAARMPGYQGCFVEGTSGRALSQRMFTSDNMTNQACRSLCSGFHYHATEYGSECYCGTQLENGAYQVPNNACNFPCAGDNQKTCGGAGLLSVYTDIFNFSNATSLAPQLDYNYLGCAREPSSGRALRHVTQVEQLTRYKCLGICNSGGFELAGVEYGNECWCGHTLGDIGFNGICDMPCAGNSSESCGGQLSLNLYTKAPYIKGRPVATSGHLERLQYEEKNH